MNVDSKKVLIATNALPPKIGGLERLTHDIASKMSDLGYSVKVLVSMDSKETSLTRVYEIAKVESVVLFERFPIPLPTISNLRLFIALRQANFQTCIIQSHLFMSNWIAALILNNKVDIVYINYGGDFVKSKSRISQIMIYLYEKVGGKIVRSRASNHYTQSELSTKRFRNLPNLKPQVLGNCLPQEIIFSKNVKEPNQEVRRLLFVGRLVEDKGILDLLEHLAMLQNHLISNHPEVFNEIELTIVGDGPLASKVHEFLNSRIVMKWIWFITQDRNQVLAEMTSQDLLIQYPTTEGQPGVTLEALSVGLPIFTTPIDNCLQNLNCVIVSNIDDFYMDLIDVILGNVKIVLDLAAVRQHLFSHHSLDSMITKLMGDNCP